MRTRALSMTALLDELEQASNAALIVGAGISYPLGIPLGYDLPMQFGAQHPALLTQFGLTSAWQKANATPKKHWIKRAEREKAFVDAFAAVFATAPLLQETMLSWLQRHPAMAGTDSDPHGVFVLAWLRRVFHHLVTTNWDFVLEQQMDTLYGQAYTGDPFKHVSFVLSDGTSCEIDAEQLFFAERLDGDDLAWNPRWDIVANEYDLAGLERWSRPLWKIHGSPFFLSCPQCRGINRWKRLGDLHIGDVCPEHPTQKLVPEIIFWGHGVDRAYPQVWHSLRARLLRCDLILIVGLSGGDTYLRDTLERHSNLWIVAPSRGAWHVRRTRFVQAYASDLAAGLVDRFLK